MKNNLILHNSFPTVNNFNSYKKYVLSIPQLSEKEELELLKKFKLENSLESAQKLILSQLRTVLFIANQFKNYGMPEEDLVQEGNIGLMKAVKNYEFSHKVRLYTYAILWIKSEIQNYILKNWKLVKIGTTKNFKKLFFNFRKIQKEMIDLGIHKNKLPEIIAQRLDVTKDEVKEIEAYFKYEDATIDLTAEDSPVLQIQDKNTPEKNLMLSHDTKVREKLLSSVMGKLNDRQKQVIEMRFFNEEKKTHKEISQIMGVSSERVRQIENESMNKMKILLQKDFNIQDVF